MQRLMTLARLLSLPLGHVVMRLQTESTMMGTNLSFRIRCRSPVPRFSSTLSTSLRMASTVSKRISGKTDFCSSMHRICNLFLLSLLSSLPG